MTFEVQWDSNVLDERYTKDANDADNSDLNKAKARLVFIDNKLRDNGY